MESPIMSLLFLAVSLLSPLEKGFGLQSQSDSQHFHTVQLSSLLPSSTCTRSSIGRDHKSSLEVVHKYGPCSNLPQNNLTLTDLTEKILQQDNLRAEYIQSLVLLSKKSDNRRFQQELGSTNLPVKPRGLLVPGAGTYFVTVGLGTPKKSLSLEIDTGSDLTWTQCLPCPAHDCYIQKEPIFNSSASSSYAVQKCSTSDLCTSLFWNSACNKAGICRYVQEYGDTSYTIGSLAKDTLTLIPLDVIPSFLFGCGNKNKGLWGGTAGLMGLGRGKISIIEQAAYKHKRLFSYCLPSNSSSTGFLIFGGFSSKAANVKYTPLYSLAKPQPSWYYLKLSAITIAGVRLDSSKYLTFIDSGGVVTKLPPALYNNLNSEFQKNMAKYPRAASYGPLDTCYDLSGAGGSVTFPKMSLTLESGAVLDLLPANIVIFFNPKQACLGFNGKGSDTLITLGNTQHLGFEVVHDITANKIGFVPNVC